MRKILAVIALIVITMSFLGCAKGKLVYDDDTTWKNNPDYDLSLPSLGKDGWVSTFEDEFLGTQLNSNIWCPSPHGERWPSQTKDPINTNYWCDDMVIVNNGVVEIRSQESRDHVCSKGVCPKEGRFTSGIETRQRIASDNDPNVKVDKQLFSQAFGYYECKVKFPNANGMWSAFWLQSTNQGKIGNDGKDGTEIDVYESAFRNHTPSIMGHALLWDGYKEHAKVSDYIGSLNYNLYDDYHTFGLKWTPEYYVFYVDGVPTWATKTSGVSKVAEFIRLTVEIDAGDEFGPHGAKIGKFENGEGTTFYIDYVKVWQNTNYLSSIVEDSYYQ